jgi:polyadenylate-binding protein 2
MDQEEHEVYGQEIPVDGADVDMDPSEDDAVKV